MRGLVCVLLVGVAGTAHADALSRIKQRGELRWGGDLQGGEPFVFQDDKDPDRIVGFEVELADALARELGVKPRFVQADWTQLLPSLDRGDFDVVMNGLEDLPDRREAYLLSRGYYTFGETLMVRKADRDRYRSLADLGGRPAGTLGNSYAERLLRAAGTEVRRYEGTQEAYLDLENGRTEAVLMDHIIADRYGRPRPALHAVPGDVATGRYVLAVRRTEPELLRALDAALERIERSGELRRILERWRIWDERQVAPVPAAAPPPAAAAPKRLGLGHLKLFLKGAGYTALISVASFLAVAIPLGLLLALARLYGGPLSRGLSATYIEIFRGTPALLQLYVLYHALAPVIRLDALSAAILGLGLNYAAYEAEVYRGAILAIPHGQTDAALALGMRRVHVLRYVVLPQAFRVALPAMTNDFIALLKDTSLVSVITVVELTKQMTITAPDVRDWVGPGLLCAALYFAMSYPLSRLAGWLERRIGAPRPRAA